MTHRAPEPDVEIPDSDITSFVLGGAAKRPEKPALIDGPTGRQLSYGELAESIRSLAAGLAASGFGRGDVLAVYLPNVPEYAIAFHGAAAAGGMCTTMNPLYTASEVAHQLEDAGARMLVTAPPFLGTAREAAERAGVEDVFVIGEAAGAVPFTELYGDAASAPAPRIDPASDLAVLPYSSGTTGLPKGVMLSHRNLVANLCQLQACFPIDSSDTLIGCLPFFHIYGMTVIMNQGLRSGATIVAMPRFDLEQFLELLEAHRVTRAYVVPPIALALAKHPAVDARDLSSLRTIMSGAAPLGAELASEPVRDRAGGHGVSHRIILAPIVRLPGSGLAAGWNLSAVVELVSGAPLNAVMSAGVSDANLGLFGGRQRPNLIGDPFSNVPAAGV